jgi:Tfp pilus assembly protein PilO
MKNKKNFNLNLNELISSNKGSDWQKGVYLAVIVVLFIFIFACGYLFIKPIPEHVEESIAEELDSIDITFNKETLENLKARQNPTQQEVTSTGKNPFAPF